MVYAERSITPKDPLQRYATSNDELVQDMYHCVEHCIILHIIVCTSV